MTATDNNVEVLTSYFYYAGNSLHHGYPTLTTYDYWTNHATCQPCTNVWCPGKTKLLDDPVLAIQANFFPMKPFVKMPSGEKKKRATGWGVGSETEVYVTSEG